MRCQSCGEFIDFGPPTPEYVTRVRATLRSEHKKAQQMKDAAEWLENALSYAEGYHAAIRSIAEGIGEYL
ncbi:MAG: hypothetical protein WC373_13675 [Smithella sp.]|jgi:hypothetical protein